VIGVPATWADLAAGSGELVASWTPRGAEPSDD
jgi:hypothetical protein